MLGANLFAYCVNNPVRYSDPSGYIALVDDAAILLALGMFLAGTALIAYVNTPSFQRSWSNLCSSIGRAVSGAWNWIKSAFTSVTKTISNTVSKAQTKIRNNYNRWNSGGIS